MRLIGKKFALAVLSAVVSVSAIGQAANVNLDKVNTVTTAVPFLRITNDTRSGGMGDVGIAMSPDANGAQLNGAKMGFLENTGGVGLSFTPWLKSLVNDIYLANLTGFYNIKKVGAIHAGLRYFSLGSIQFTNEHGDNTIQVRPQELAVDLGYARRLGKIVSVGATLRFIYSDIAPGGVDVGGTGGVTKPGMAGAADISVLVDKIFEPKQGNMRHELYWGLCMSNIGSKITYTSNTVKDYIPANLGMGLGYKLHLDKEDKYTVAVYLDLNKLLVPTPIPVEQLYIGSGSTRTLNPIYDKNGNGVPDYKEQSPITALFTSFADAPGGALEELREISTAVGAEFMYKKMFGVRLGYFYEHPTKGNRQYLTVGATVKYSVATLHVSYLVPTSNLRNPLDNTFRLSLAFEFSKGSLKKKQPADAAPADNGEAAPAAPALLDKPRKAKKSKDGKETPPTQEVQPMDLIKQ